MWAALGKAAVGAVKGGAKKIATDKLMNRKKKTDARRAAAQKMMGGEEGGEEKGGAIVVRPKAALVQSPAGAIEKYSGGDQQQSGGGEDLQGLVLQIKTSVISVESLLGNSVALQKKKLDDERKAREAAELGKAEKDLEKKKPKAASKGPKIKIPGKGILSSIMDFVINIAFGWIAVRLVNFGPQLAKILPAIGTAADWLVNSAVFIITGLGTLIDWGYKFVEMGRGLVNNVFGEEGAKKFDTFMNSLKNLISGFLIWKLIGKKIFKAIVQNIKNTFNVIKSVFAKAGKFLNWMTGGRAGNVAKNVLGKGANLAKNVGGKILNVGKNLLGKGGQKAAGGVTKTLKSIFKKGIGKAGKRLVLKFFGKTAAKIFGKIPIIGPVIVGIVSLMSGEPIGQALFKTLGAAVGGLLGTFIPIPVIGTLIGEAIGVFVGDLLYHLIVKRDPKAAFQMLKDTFMKIFSAGKAIFNFFKDGFVRFVQDFPTVPVPDIKPGEILANFIDKIPGYKQIMNMQVPNWRVIPKWLRGFSLRKLLDGLPSTQEFLGMFAQFIPGLNKYVVDGKLTKIPNLALLTPLGAPFLIPHLAKSFLPGMFGGGSGGSSPSDAKSFSESGGDVKEPEKQEDPLKKEKRKLKEKRKKLDEKYKKKLNNMQSAIGDFVIGVGDAMKIDVGGDVEDESKAPVINKTNDSMNNKISSVSKETTYEENAPEVVKVPVIVKTQGSSTQGSTPVVSGGGGGSGNDPYEVLDFQG